MKAAHVGRRKLFVGDLVGGAQRREPTRLSSRRPPLLDAPLQPRKLIHGASTR